MKSDKSSRIPEYIPKYYRIFIKFRKFLRQTKVRIVESMARRGGCAGVEPDGAPVCIPREERPAASKSEDINRSDILLDEDMERPEIRALAVKMEKVKEKLEARELKYTNTAGTFLSRMFYPRSERTKLWENLWVISRSDVKPGHRVLDIGGASTAFSFYLADLGCSVAVIDNDWGNCGTVYNANYVARAMGWDLKAYDHDVARRFPFRDNSFDRIFSICTVEHLSSPVRRAMMKETARVLKPGGIVGLTMCYCNDMNELLVDKGLRFAYLDKLKRDIIEPSGLRIYGNKNLSDTALQENFLGVLFLTKTFPF